MMKSSFVLAFAFLISFKAYGQSASQIVNEAIQDRSRASQIERNIREVEKQLDRMKDEKNKLSRDVRLDIGGVLNLLQEYEQIGNCRVTVVSQSNAVLMTVVGKNGQTANLTFDPKQLRSADVDVKIEANEKEGMAQVKAENMKDVFGNKTKLYMNIDHRNRLQEMRIMAKDFDTKECKR